MVTPWTDHLDLAKDYFDALEAGPAPQETIVVDNASSPPLEFGTIRSEVNLGFSKGSNEGLRAATSEVVVFLNNDIAATKRGWLWKLVQHVEPGVLAGAKLRFDLHGDVGGERLPYLDGWCLAGMREELLELGGFDESFEEPAYYSDNELCLRARLEGMTLREVPGLGLIHKGGVTTGSNAYILPSTNANRIRYHSMVEEFFGVTT